MPDTQLIENISVKRGYICHDKLSGNQFEEHIRADVAGTRLLIGTVGFAPGLLERGSQEASPDPVEVYLHFLRDTAAVLMLIGKNTSFRKLNAEGHGYKYPESSTATAYNRIQRWIR
jgi:hypothetical protein